MCSLYYAFPSELMIAFIHPDSDPDDAFTSGATVTAITTAIALIDNTNAIA